MNAMALSYSRLNGVIFGGSDEAVEYALTTLRSTRVQFVAAQADYRESRLTFKGRPPRDFGILNWPSSAV